MSRKTIKNVLSLVSTAYDKAMKADYEPLVDTNPFHGRAPSQTHPDEIERIYLSPEQFQIVLERVVEHDQPFMLFLVLTGLRWGEAAGLRVCDVTLDPAQVLPYLEVGTEPDPVSLTADSVGRCNTESWRCCGGCWPGGAAEVDAGRVLEGSRSRRPGQGCCRGGRGGLRDRS